MAIASGSYPEGHWFESNRRHHMWTLSSAGRASALQAEGHRFEPYSVHHFYGRVVQLVRMPACHAGGRRFEPVPGRQLFKKAHDASRAKTSSRMRRKFRLVRLCRFGAKARTNLRCKGREQKRIRDKTSSKYAQGISLSTRHAEREPTGAYLRT